jgi:hypothetical protein
MLVRFTKDPPATGHDTLTCVRPDGSATSAALQRQGVLPHEAIHFVVETSLGWRDAMFGDVERGATLEEAHLKLHGGSRAWSKMTQALQTEALVDALQTEQWSGAHDPAAFAEQLIAACRRKGVPPPDVTAEEIDRVRTAVREFGAAWRPLAPGRSLERTF